MTYLPAAEDPFVLRLAALVPQAPRDEKAQALMAFMPVGEIAVWRTKSSNSGHFQNTTDPMAMAVKLIMAVCFGSEDRLDCVCQEYGETAFATVISTMHPRAIHRRWWSKECDMSLWVGLARNPIASAALHAAALDAVMRGDDGREPGMAMSMMDHERSIEAIARAILAMKPTETVA